MVRRTMMQWRLYRVACGGHSSGLGRAFHPIRDDPRFQDQNRRPKIAAPLQYAMAESGVASGARFE